MTKRAKIGYAVAFALCALVAIAPRPFLFAYQKLKCVVFCASELRFSDPMWISEPLSGEDYGYFRYTKYDSPFSGKVRDYLVLIPSPNANCIREGHEVAEAGDLKLKALASGVRDCLLATEKGPKMHRAGPLEWLLGINDRKELIAVAVPIEGRYFYSEKLSAVLVVSSNVALNEVLDWRIEAR